MITRDDVRAQVDRIVGDERESYDLEALVAELIDEHGLIDLDNIPAADLDGIFLRHERCATEPADPFGPRWPGRDGRPLPHGRR